MEKKLKILLLLKFPLYGGGSGAFTRRLAEKLAKTGKYEVAVAAPDNRPIPGVKVFPIKPAYKAVFESHPEWKRARRYSEMTGEEFTRQYLSFLGQITEIVIKFKPDVIHVNHAHFLTWIASYLKSMFGICYVVSVHGTGLFNATLDRRFLVLMKQAVNRAEQIMPVSPHTKKWFLKICGQNLKYKTKVIAHGIDSHLYEKNISTSLIDKKYFLKDKKVVMFVGRLTREKGLEYLIRAAKKIKGEIIVVGDGSYKDYFVNYAKLIGVKNIRFLGYLGKDNTEILKQFYRRADVLVVPSVADEALGLVVLEAMASQTPVVASNKGGIPLVVKNNYNGFLVRSRSSQAIANAVNKILKDPALRQKLAENAHRTVLEKFDWEAILPQFESIYKKTAQATTRLKAMKPKSILDKDQLARERKELHGKIDYVKVY